MEKYLDKNKIIAVLIAMVVLAGAVLFSLEASNAVTVGGSVVKGNQLQFVYSTSTSGNTTTISWSLVCTRTVTSTKTYKTNAPTTVVVNGSTRFDGKTTYDVRNGSKTLASGSVSVARSNGAAKTVPFSGSVNLSGTSVGGSISVSGNISLSAYTAGTKDVTVNVDWIDNGNIDGDRPENVTIILYRNGTEYKTASMSTSTNKVTFTGVPIAYGGTAYTYKAGGSSVANYSVSEATGLNITYTYNIVPELGLRIGFAI